MQGQLGEVKMFALSMSGAVTKTILQGTGWAICDGTTPVSQGITSPIIATTPNLEDKFIRMSDDETSGTTGGSDTTTYTVTASQYEIGGSNALTHVDGGPLYLGNNTKTNMPAYYEMAFFIKVK